MEKQGEVTLWPVWNSGGRVFLDIQGAWEERTGSGHGWLTLVGMGAWEAGDQPRGDH